MTLFNDPAAETLSFMPSSESIVEKLALGERLCLAERFPEAEAVLKEVIKSQPDTALAHNHLGGIREVQGDADAAIVHYQHALEIEPNCRIARRNLAKLLVRAGRADQGFYLWHAEMLTDEAGIRWIQDLIASEMRNRSLHLAGEYAAILARLRWGSTWCTGFKNGAVPVPSIPPAAAYLTVPKLRHDIEQFEYLQRRGVVGLEFTPIVDAYHRAIERLATSGANVRLPLTEEDRKTIGHVYNRIIHIRQTPRRNARALSSEWDPREVEQEYLAHSPGVVVIDNFLTPESLEEVRLFCLESTVWFANRYAHGRLGAFFHDGFNCPLLVQIAEELREYLPNMIGSRYSLRQLWGFKNDYYLPADSTIHADFAAVNVNFWITPDDANLDPSAGGLVVYPVDAPLHWDFVTYNSRSDVIRAFLARQGVRPTRIAYRQNRAVIFNSDLFHGTEEVKFRQNYESRRINVTMLYGDREADVHHRQLARPDPMFGTAGSSYAWRSAAFPRTHARK
jgi:hypothetical protein